MAKIPINNFDKFIREKVETHRTPVDTDRLWSNIQKTGRSKRTGILPGALLLLLVSFFITVHILDNYNAVNKAADINNSTAATATMYPENVAQQISKNYITSSLETSSERVGPAAILIRNEVPSKLNSSGTKINSAKKQSLKNVQSGLQSAPLMVAADNSEIVSVEIDGDQSYNTVLNASRQDASNIISEIINEDINVNAKYEKENSSVFAELDNLPILGISEVQTELLFPQMILLPHDIRIQHAKFRKGFEVRMNGGVGMVLRNMELLNPEARQWMQSRMAAEHQLEAVRWGMDVKLRLSKNVYFFAGIEEMRINEQFNYESVEQRMYVKDNELARVVYNEDSYIEELGSVDYFEEIHKRGTFYNQFRMINIPVGVGVFQKMGKFSLGLEGAVLINAFHQFDGKIADASNDLIEMKDAGFRVSQMQTARINGVFSYQLSSGWGLNLMTGADLPLRNIQVGNHMSQNYMVFQGNFGVCYSW